VIFLKKISRDEKLIKKESGHRSSTTSSIAEIVDRLSTPSTENQSQETK